MTSPIGHPSQATRYLCAGVYVDWRFADWVVDHVLHTDHSTPAPSHGVDVVPVVRHAVRARTWRLVRTLLLTIVLAGLPAAVLLGGAPALDALVRTVLLAWAVVFGALCFTHYEIVVQHMLRDRFDANAVPALRPAAEARIVELLESRTSNVTVYSGFSPFVGCGLSLGSWSFVVDSRRGREDFDGTRLRARPFEASDLYQFTEERLHALHLPRLRTENRLFVHGREARNLRWLLPDILDRPRAVVDRSAVRHFLQFPTEQVRHYLAVELVEWEGELALSIFLRFSLTSGNLFCEASYFLLPPIRERFHEVDDMHAAPDLTRIVRLFVRSLLTTPFALLAAPIVLLMRLLEPVGRWYKGKMTRRLIRLSPTFDYGTTETLRGHATDTNYRHYFQKLDKEMYAKLAEQQIFDSIITFLDEHNVDTNDIKERQTTVMNSGVIVSGSGSISANNFAVGVMAKAGDLLHTAKGSGRAAPPQS
jgi:hypothetical protein